MKIHSWYTIYWSLFKYSLEIILTILWTYVCVLSRVWLFVSPGTAAPGSSVHEESPGKNTGAGCHALLQGIVSTQESNALQADSLPTEPSGRPLLGIIIFNHRDEETEDLALYLSQCHRSSKWQSRNSNIDVLGFSAWAFSIVTPPVCMF